MLQRLHIQNYAIIDNLVVEFSPQLNIITGETGAGKSILLGALSLILGERAGVAALKQDDRKCVVEGVFDIEHRHNVLQLLKELELDADHELIIRREITAAGKSRAFVNDTPVNLQQLKQLTSLLVDLHQQFDTLELGDAGFQREVLDALAGNDAVLKQYRKVFSSLQQAVRQLDVLEQQKTGFRKEYDYNHFLLEELAALGLKENELEDLEAELKTLSHAGDIQSGLARIYTELKESEQPVVQTLKQVMQQLQAQAAYHPALPEMVQRLNGVYVELDDIAEELNDISLSVTFDEERMAIINDRMAAGYKLLKKHNARTTADLLEIQAGLEAKLQGVLQTDEEITRLETVVSQLRQEATRLAAVLHEARLQAADPFSEEVNGLLHQVGMPNARIKVTLTPVALHAYGSDEIAFLFDANRTNRFEPLAKVASGGELSRLMLCIKSLVARSIQLPTMIFDEIDTGISGEAARQVGIILKTLTQSRQVVCITHQPQIAGKAHRHLFVYKEQRAEEVRTNIRTLSTDERIQAIARMLSGEQPTAAALENAREMVEAVG
jgi:DNA repair protein RecN (Recombination protein N)